MLQIGQNRLFGTVVTYTSKNELITFNIIETAAKVNG